MVSQRAYATGALCQSLQVRAQLPVRFPRVGSIPKVRRHHRLFWLRGIAPEQDFGHRWFLKWCPNRHDLMACRFGLSELGDFATSPFELSMRFVIVLDDKTLDERDRFHARELFQQSLFFRRLLVGGFVNRKLEHLPMSFRNLGKLTREDRLRQLQDIAFDPCFQLFGFLLDLGFD